MERTEEQILKELAELKDKLPEETTVEDLITKAKGQEMEKIKDKSKRVQVGSWIDRQLWQRLKAQAAIEDRGAGYVLDDAIELYLQSKKKENKED